MKLDWRGPLWLKALTVAGFALYIFTLAQVIPKDTPGGRLFVPFIAMVYWVPVVAWMNDRFRGEYGVDAARRARIERKRLLRQQRRRRLRR
ncbi:MAG TPA: hypothetical protein VFC19_50325 [Candidatus Limnocylindrales bacterium]|nr:hypothetical protein [Candidatus Limnocylindrales bacterium]